MFSIWYYELARKIFVGYNISINVDMLLNHFIKNSVFKFIGAVHIICIFDELPRHHFSFKNFTTFLYILRLVIKLQQRSYFWKQKYN